MTFQFNIRNLCSKCGQKDPARKNVMNTSTGYIVTETVKLLDVLQFAHGRHQNKGVHKGRFFVVRQVNHK